MIRGLLVSSFLGAGSVFTGGGATEPALGCSRVNLLIIPLIQLLHFYPESSLPSLELYYSYNAIKEDEQNLQGLPEVMVDYLGLLREPGTLIIFFA